MSSIQVDKKETGHTFEEEKKQTDASVEHLVCYLRRISTHKGTFIGLPSICGVQEQTLDSTRQMILSRRGWGVAEGEGGEERVWGGG